MAEDEAWEGVDDPEELSVIFHALDSYWFAPVRRTLW